MAKPTNSSAGSRAGAGDRYGSARTPDTTGTGSLGSRIGAGSTARTAGGTRPGGAAAPGAGGRRTPEGARVTASRAWPRRDTAAGVASHLSAGPPPRPPWNGALAAAGPSTGRGRPLPPRTRRMYARRRRSMLLVFLLVAGIVLLVGQAVRNNGDPVPTAVTVAPAAPLRTVAPQDTATDTATAAPATSATSASAGPTTTAASTPRPAAATATTATASASPSRTTAAATPFTYATTAGPVLGTAGSLRRFKVAVEKGQNQDARDFADDVDRILGDPRSWIAGRQYRLQRVAPGTSSEFTVFLASAATSEKMCAAGGLQTAGYTSCRLGGEVVMNLDRWQQAVPDYGAPLATYQAYALNHEVGHQLGHGHEACPGKGAKAPVMQQQTYGLKGCTANAWPYLDGKRYVGEPVD